MTIRINAEIATVFRETADLLAAQGAGPFRLRAYRAAAEAIEGLDISLAETLRFEGREGLIRLPTIGRSLAASIDEYIHTGHCRTLDRLRGHMAPADLYTRIPGIGEKLAARIHSTLQIDSLEELEAAALDGSLSKVRGLGDARSMAVADHLARRLDASSRRRSSFRSPERGNAPMRSLSIAAILEIDSEFRELVDKGQLTQIAPHRHNPGGKVWMSVWHTEREGWSLTVMFSNSELAHRLKKTLDWVIVVANQDGNEEQFTVVTEYRGEFSGARVVRGRESECATTLARLRDETAMVVHEIRESL